MDACPRRSRPLACTCLAFARVTIWRLVLLLALWVAAPGLAQEGPARMAFVVGNAIHDGEKALHEAGHNAREIASVLERQGLEVSLLLNSDAATFAAAFESFTHRAEGAALALVYFSGYGLRAGGSDYLLPIDLAPESAAAVQAGAIALDRLIARLASADRPTVLLLEANHPLDLSEETRLAAGLGAPVPGRETLIALATQPGTLAPVGSGQHFFSAALIEALAGEGQSLDQMLADLVDNVRTRSAGQQVPWLASSLSAPAFIDPFVPDEEDLARLAAMPEQQRNFLIGVWLSQGARFGNEEKARLSALTEAAIPLAPPQFSFEFIEDAPQPSTQSEMGAQPVAPPMAKKDAPRRLVSQPDEPTARRASTPTRPEFETDTTAAATVAITPDPTPPTDLPPAPMRRDAINLAAVAPAATGTAAGAAAPVALTMLSARAVNAQPAIADKPIARIRSEDEPLLLTSLGPAQNLRPEPDTPDRLIGRDVTEGYLVPEDLPSAVQTELARLGCYRVGIDGIWGNGSRRALERYIDSQDSALTSLEPTEEAWRELLEVTGTICTAPAPAPRATHTPRASQPVARAPTLRQEAPASHTSAPAAPAQNNAQLRRALTTGFR